MIVNDVKHHYRYQNLSRQAIIQQIVKEYKAEEMRILYVAMTRAREKLILTGTVRNMEKFAQYACSQLQTTTKTLPDYFIMQAKSYLDWLTPAIARHKDGLVLRQSATNESAVLLDDPSQWQISLINSLDITDKTIISTVNEDIINKVKKLQPLPLYVASSSKLIS